MLIHAGVSGWKSRITVEEESRRDIGKPCRLDAFIEGIGIEMDEAAVAVKHWEVRFPPQTVVQGESAVHFPDVGTIKRDVLSSLVLISVGAHRERGRISGEKVRHG